MSIIPLADQPDRSRSTPGTVPPAERRAGRLPVPLTSLVGRELEVAAISRLLREAGARLVTLIGPGGVGKTRLAVEVARQLSGAYRHGVVFVDLSSIRDPALVAPAVAEALGLRDGGTRSLLEQVSLFLRDQRVLLILDNFEQLIAAASDLTILLAEGPGVSLLVTSRVRLSISSEHTFVVRPLPLPEGPRPAPRTGREITDALHAATGNDSVRLFVERARAVDPGFALTEANAAAAAEVVRRLDGLPLAIELAAARVHVLPPPALLDRLDNRLRLLTGGPRDYPTRLRTMSSAIAWSYDLLSPQQQDAFRRLAVFEGGFTIDAAEAVLDGAMPEGDVVNAVGALVDASLLRREDRNGEIPRFGMLETVREFGLARLADEEDEPAVRDAHAFHLLALAEEAAPELQTQDQQLWLERLTAEHANLRAALHWLDRTGRHEELLRLAWALLFFWWYRGHVAEGQFWLDRALAAPVDPSLPLRGWVAFGAGMLAINGGNTDEMVRHAVESRTVARQHGLFAAEGAATMILAWTALMRLDHEEAERLAVEAEALLRRSGDGLWLANILGDLGVILVAAGRVERGMAWLEEALTLDRARGNRYFAAVRLSDLGMAAQETGNTVAATRSFLESARLLLEIGEAWYLASPLAGLAAYAAPRDPARATRLLAAADALRSRSGFMPWPTERERDERALATARALLGDEAFDREWAAGQALTPAVAVALAEAATAPGPRGPATEVSALTAALSPREREVLRLLVAGQTDREIAETLFISPRTASKHVGAILAKLEVASRGEAAALAVREGLL